MKTTDLTSVRAILERIPELNGVLDHGVGESDVVDPADGGTTQVTNEETRPLWLWIRDGFWRAPPAMRHSFLSRLESNFFSLGDLGIAPLQHNTTAVLLTPVSHTSLRGGVGGVLSRGSSAYDCELAVALAGFAGFASLADDIFLLTQPVTDLGRPALFEASAVSGALMLLEAFDQFDRLDGVPEDTRLECAARRLHTVNLRVIEAALGSLGWTAGRLRKFPHLLEAYACAGGDMVAAMNGIVNSGPVSYAPELDLYAGAAAARALAAASHSQGLTPIEMLMGATTLSRPFRAAAYIEFASTRCQRALPALETRLGVLSSAGLPQRERDEECTPLIWAIAVLRRDGVQWLAARIAASVGDSALLAAAIVLAIVRDDAAEFLENRTKAPWPDGLEKAALCARMIIAGDAAGSSEFVSSEPLDEVRQFAHWCLRAAELGERISAPFSDALELLRSPDHPGLTSQRSSVDPLSIVRHLHSWLCPTSGDLGALLFHVRFVPAPAAAAILEGVVTTQLLSGNRSGSMNMMPRWPIVEKEVGAEIALVELGCVPGFQERIAPGTASLLRLHTGGEADATQRDIDRLLAVALLASQSRVSVNLHSDLLYRMNGDFAFNVVATTLAFAGSFADDSSGRDESQKVHALAFKSLSGDGTDTILAEPERIPSAARATTAIRLMCSASEVVRARATVILFDRNPLGPEHAALRQAHLRDGAKPVQRSLLDAIGKSVFTPAELRAILASNAVSEATSRRAGAARAIGRLGSTEHFDLLLPLLSDVRDSVAHAAQNSMREICSSSNTDLVCLAIGDQATLASFCGITDRDPREHGLAQRMQMLLLAIGRWADKSAVTRHCGRRVLITPIHAWPPPAMTGTPIQQVEFQQIAMHLHVIYVDGEGETGQIVAEVGAKPTGEILNAIFETGEAALMQVVWT